MWGAWPVAKIRGIGILKKIKGKRKWRKWQKLLALWGGVFRQIFGWPFRWSNVVRFA